jgi:SpoVK/Ycf46/Vps4 family AAA+-type ATPase
MKIQDILKNADYQLVGSYDNGRLTHIFDQLLKNYAAKTLTTVWEKSFSKEINDLQPNFDYKKALEILKSDKFNFSLLYSFDSGKNKDFFLYNNIALIQLKSHVRDSYFQVELSSLDKPFYEELVKEIKTWFKVKDIAGKIFLLEVQHDELSFNELGTIGMPLIRENYTQNINESYDYIVKELPNKDPRGRLVILNGFAGMGKTFLIRALAQDTKDCVFAVIMPHQLNSLTNPATIPALIQLRETYKGKSIVFIIEDGDSLIVTRDDGNVNQIAQLLNLSDGLLGSSLDLKFVVSTNADHIDIDEAIKRPGRLMRHVSFDKLSFEHSLRIYKRLRLTDSEYSGMVDKSYSLAEIYALAKEADTNFDVKPKKLGFGF